MSTFEERRKLNIKQNKLLLADLSQAAQPLQSSQTTPSSQPRPKKRKLNHAPAVAPTRRSARVSKTEEKPVYNEDELVVKPRSVQVRSSVAVKSESPAPSKHRNVDGIVAGWTAWTPVASAPTRDDLGTLHFESHPDFLPNKSPEEIMREGCFGGSYFRPLRSKALGITVSDDWEEIPAAWHEGLDVAKYLTSETYDPEVNKYGVKCGQSIEEWEAAGWIMHEYDVRGWFQWYIRFYLGRRCLDDERQISRWAKCVGPRGRWRRALLKKYVQMGIRTVGDEGDEEDEREVSPVVHQTCHHWAWEVRQDVLDEYWRGDG
ncbi:hypothetical protein BP6252_13005 [Coleophoma cylindrospora]|uniref:Vegetatible incompatibility protein HET-E-1 n=1 Tax=Coleophoma cylindrospora TaxID=1849047 RepID=A0A3D8QE64_9HELO|nr:hypothetical protein BP6252_13005 [Coleophoma cylindrospora]